MIPPCHVTLNFERPVAKSMVPVAVPPVLAAALAASCSRETWLRFGCCFELQLLIVVNVTNSAIAQVERERDAEK